MGKHEPPPFKMIVERGKLIPATPYDAERLDTYTNGVRVNVRFTEDKDRVLVRKWWAILGRAVKECKTPWKNKEQASEAIKLALGIVNYTKTVGGEFMAYPKSLTELEDPELSDAVGQMIDVVYNVTGVDPSVWRKHVEHIRDDENDQPASSPADREAATDTSSPSVAATNSAEPTALGNPGGSEESEAGQRELSGLANPSRDASTGRSGESEEGAGSFPETVKADHGDQSAPSSPTLSALKSECITKLLGIVNDQHLTKEEAAQTLGETADIWCAQVDDVFVKAVFGICRKVLKGELKLEAARKYLEGLL